MKKSVLFFVSIVLFIANPVLAQSQSDSIQVQKKLGTIFVQNGKALTPRQLMEITKVNSEAYAEMKIARANYGFAQVLGGVGGFCVGWPLGTAVGGGDPNWTLAGIGAALIIVSIPITSSYTAHAKKAVGIFNSGLRQAVSVPVIYNFGYTGNGIGLYVRF